jgi:predicted TIM-barrel fold metal-dependent hydrolase
MGVTDCHVHINPIDQMRPEARAIFGAAARADVAPYIASPRKFLDYLDECGVDRAVLMNYVAPDVVGYTDAANEFVSQYAAHDPARLIAVGGLLPTHRDPGGRVRELVERLGLRGIKVHPSHQLVAPNGYVDGTAPGLREIYRECEALRVPVIIHTGTSVFPKARNRFAHPMLVEDVAIDFPELTLVLAHGGRPLWMDEAVFLARRFPNVYLELSSIPPSRLLQYFPRLEELAPKTLFGSDWPGPGVPDIGENLRAFQALPLSDSARERILVANPEKVFPRGTP